MDGSQNPPRADRHPSESYEDILNRDTRPVPEHLRQGPTPDIGVDAVPGEMTDLDKSWLSRKLEMYGLKAPNGVEKMQKIVAGRQLWNYDNLEPAEKKLIL